LAGGQEWSSLVALVAELVRASVAFIVKQMQNSQCALTAAQTPSRRVFGRRLSSHYSSVNFDLAQLCSIPWGEPFRSTQRNFSWVGAGRMEARTLEPKGQEDDRVARGLPHGSRAR